ncbi:MAG: type II toxin-antitoxin system VapC family toxin [Actinomycetota bacterium]
MTAYADSSAIVKLYVDEESSERMRTWAGPIFVSAVVKVDVTGAIWRKQRLDQRPAAAARLTADSFHRDLEAFSGQVQLLPLVLTPAILERATDLVARHPLRAYDAVQLATAMEAREVVPVEEFLAFDRTLCTAAAVEGFDVPFDEPISVSP